MSIIVVFTADSIALAVSLNTKVLLMDEPSNGLDIPSKIHLRRIISQNTTDEQIASALIAAIETPDNPRALPAEELEEAIRPYNAHVRAEKNIKKAVEELFEMTDKDDVILSFGSLSFIGEITRVVNAEHQ